jgi:hypothetical protein
MKFLLPFLFISGSVFAQNKDYSKDVASVNGILSALYDVISGEQPGLNRDWARFKNLFKHDGRMNATRKSPEGELTLQTLSQDDYIQLFSSKVTTGFFENELHREVEQYGTLVHVFSTYETREKKDGPATNRGINSVQLFFDGKRYYIVNVLWCAEGLGFPLPKKYLKQ